jgi:hypothetical protein
MLRILPNQQKHKTTGESPSIQSSTHAMASPLKSTLKLHLFCFAGFEPGSISAISKYIASIPKDYLKDGIKVCGYDYRPGDPKLEGIRKRFDVEFSNFLLMCQRKEIPTEYTGMESGLDSHIETSAIYSAREEIMENSVELNLKESKNELDIQKYEETLVNLWRRAYQTTLRINELVHEHKDQVLFLISIPFIQRVRKLLAVLLPQEQIEITFFHQPNIQFNIRTNNNFNIKKTYDALMHDDSVRKIYCQSFIPGASLFGITNNMVQSQIIKGLPSYCSFSAPIIASYLELTKYTDGSALDSKDFESKVTPMVTAALPAPAINSHVEAKINAEELVAWLKDIANIKEKKRQLEYNPGTQAVSGFYAGQEFDKIRKKLSQLKMEEGIDFTLIKKAGIGFASKPNHVVVIHNLTHPLLISAVTKTEAPEGEEAPRRTHTL